MGEAKRRREAGLPPRTVQLPALTLPEAHALHHLLHHRVDELKATPPEQLDDARREELQALQALHQKLFAH